MRYRLCLHVYTSQQVGILTYVKVVAEPLIQRKPL